MELELLPASPATRAGSPHLLFYTVFSLGNSEMESNKEKDGRVGRGTTTADNKQLRETAAIKQLRVEVTSEYN